MAKKKEIVKAVKPKIKIYKYKCYRCDYQTDERADNRVCPSCGGRVQ